MLAEKATKGQISIIKVDNLATALFLVSMGKGICIAPRYVTDPAAMQLMNLFNTFTDVSYDTYTHE